MTRITLTVAVTFLYPVCLKIEKKKNDQDPEFLSRIVITVIYTAIKHVYSWHRQAGAGFLLLISELLLQRNPSQAGVRTRAFFVIF